LISNHFSTFSRKERIFIGDIDSFLFKTLDPTFKGAVLRYESIISYLNLVNKQNFTFKVLNEAFLINQFVFYFTKNYFLVDKVNKKIGEFHSSGLIQFWMSKYFTDKSTRKTDGPSSLNVKRLEGVFEVLLFGWVVSVFVFTLELFAARVLRVKKWKWQTMCFKKT
jgi:hypothetical protein